MLIETLRDIFLLIFFEFVFQKDNTLYRLYYFLDHFFLGLKNDCFSDLTRSSYQFEGKLIVNWNYEVVIQFYNPLIIFLFEKEEKMEKEILHFDLMILAKRNPV